LLTKVYLLWPIVKVPIKFHGAMEPQPLHLLFFVDPECSYQVPFYWLYN
jgi:hypothetical protein